jgi:hypothetical protein
VGHPPSLRRGWVCNLLVQLLLGFTREALSGPSLAERTVIFYWLIWDAPNLEGQVPVFISLRNRVAQLYPRALGSIFLASYNSQSYSEGILTRLHMGLSCKVKVYIITDSQFASLPWCQAPIWDPWPTFSLLSLIIFRQLGICWCGAPSLMRSRICSLQFLLGITSAAFLRSESHGTLEHILLSLFFRLHEPWRPGSCIYFPQEQGRLYCNSSSSSSYIAIDVVCWPVWLGVGPPLGQMPGF